MLSLSSFSSSCGLVIVCVGLGFLLGWFLAQSTSRSSHHHETSRSIEILARQAARWSVAAEQDKAPLIALLHANYGAAYLWALKDISTDTQFTQATSLDPLAFEAAIVRVQDNATQQATTACPGLLTSQPPLDSFLLGVSGDTSASASVDEK